MMLQMAVFCSAQAEELIKQEMLTMLHYDAVQNPSASQQGLTDPTKKQKAAAAHAQHLSFLEDHPYSEIEEEHLKEVETLFFPQKF